MCECDHIFLICHVFTFFQLHLLFWYTLKCLYKLHNMYNNTQLCVPLCIKFKLQMILN